MLASIRRQWRRENLRALARLPLVAFCFAVVIEVFARRSFDDTVTFLFTHPAAFLYETLILYACLSLALLAKKRMFWFCLIATVCVGLSVADFILLTYRSMPLTASDILLMGSVRDIFEKYISHVGLALMMVAISLVLGTILFLWCVSPKGESVLSLGAANLLVACALVFAFGEPLAAAGLLPSSEEFGNLPEAYAKGGFVYSFAASAVTGGVDEPPQYTPDIVEEIVDVRKELPETAERTPNIVFVQLESFFDANYMRDLTYDTDPVPNFRALKESCSTGLLSVPAIGAGTANTEFEVLTGMNLNHFGVGEYPYMTIVSNRTAESAATVLSDLGYATHAIHNNNATFYDRHLVYANLGFDTFTPIEYMSDLTYNPLGWADDSVLVTEIVDALNATEESDFVFAVSVQPHGRYPREPIAGAETFGVSGMADEERANGYAYYLQQLHECDEFVGELVAALSDYPEPVAVVFYGDHLPSFNIANDELSHGDVQTTEYVIWANYSMAKKDRDLQTYQLAAYVMDRCRIHEGTIFCLHQSCDYATEDDASYQDDLKLLEYDLLDGKGYASDGEQTPSMRYGVRPITAESLTAEDGTVTIVGENFTDASVIFKNDAPLETSGDGTTRTAEDVPEEGDRYYVAQVSADDGLTVLSQTAELVWQGDTPAATE